MMCQQSEYVFGFFFHLTEEECNGGGKSVEKPFSPPSPVQPAGRCSQAATAMEQRSAGAAGKGHSSEILPG